LSYTIREDSYVSNESSNDKENLIPPNVVDFDALNADDLFSVSAYVKDIFAYYKSREVSRLMYFPRLFRVCNACFIVADVLRGRLHGYWYSD
jgi:hypothetical protein